MAEREDEGGRGQEEAEVEPERVAWREALGVAPTTEERTRRASIASRMCTVCRAAMPLDIYIQ